MNKTDNPAAAKIQNREILGVDACESKTGCGGCGGSCGKHREKIATIWYVVAALVVVLASLGLKALGVF